MKKTILILASAVLALAACNKVDIIEENHGDAIAFRPFTSPLTRAASAADIVEPAATATSPNQALTKFNVVAFNHGVIAIANAYIPDVTYVKNTVGSSYAFYHDADAASANYANEYYWPVGKMDFYAYSWYDRAWFGAEQTNPQIVKVAYNQFTFTPTKSVEEADPAYPHADLVYATIQNIAKGDTYGSGTYGSLGIPLNFRHTASKIVVQVKNTSSTLKFSIDAWKIGYLDDSGTFTLSETSTVTKHLNAEANQSSNLLAFSDWTNNATAAVTNEYVSNLSTAVDVAVSTTTATALAGEMILVPQTLTAATAYANSGSAAIGDALGGTFIAVKLKIMNNDANSTVIAGTASDSTPVTYGTMWAIWQTGGYNWEPGKKYTYTIDLAGGGYYETNQDTNADLDPILENTLIRFVDVTVDQWQDYDYDSTTTGVQPIPVSGPANS